MKTIAVIRLTVCTMILLFVVFLVLLGARWTLLGYVCFFGTGLDVALRFVDAFVLPAEKP